MTVLPNMQASGGSKVCQLDCPTFSANIEADYNLGPCVGNVPTISSIPSFSGLCLEGMMELVYGNLQGP